MAKPTIPFSDVRFQRKVQITDSCWLWTGCLKKRDGYGWVGRNKKQMGAHRYAWILINGPIPDGLCVLHKCDNPPCVNPDHLFLGTQVDNIRDMQSKGRQACNHLGQANPNAKLSVADVHTVRLLCAHGVKQSVVARLFGVKEGCISKIMLNRTWKLI